MKNELRRIEQEALQEIESSKGARDLLEQVRIKYLGRKGIITELFKKMGELSPDDKRETGALINAVKINVTMTLEENIKNASAIEEEHVEKIDITLPGIGPAPGTQHPITTTIQEICEIFISLGFMVVEGPEIETEYYNFEALNIPLEHPSRDAFDTFYLKETSKPANQQTSKHKFLLRSHTSPVQARFMEKHKPPFSIIVPGRVFRPDATDASHSFMFHQVEGLAVGEDIRFSDLKGVLEVFARQMFGQKTKMRFRPSFFPFTEPSAEVDISCIICGGPRDEGRRTRDEGRRTRDEGRGTKDEGRRCSVCGGKGWLEILGAGMVNPEVFKKVGYDPEKVTGFAFGMGVERIAMLKYGVNDIRLFFENDVRFLRQF